MYANIGFLHCCIDVMYVIVWKNFHCHIYMTCYLEIYIVASCNVCCYLGITLSLHGTEMLSLSDFLNLCYSLKCIRGFNLCQVFSVFARPCFYERVEISALNCKECFIINLKIKIKNPPFWKQVEIILITTTNIFDMCRVKQICESGPLIMNWST